MYQAKIYYQATEDSYIEGEIGTSSTEWTHEFTAKTAAELTAKVLEATYSKLEDLESEQINDYEFATEYETGYMADAENIGTASESQIDQWKAGTLRLWYVSCHILVSEVNETPATLVLA